jgi:hypothetical protein
MRTSFTSKQSKSLLTLVCVPGLIVAHAGCGADTASTPTTPSGGMTASGGTGGTTAGTGGVAPGGAGGAAQGGSTGGTAPGGAGGVAAGAGGAAGGAVGGGGTGGAAGGAANMGPACSMAAGTNDANLSVRRPEISTRVVAGSPAGNMMRIEYDKVSMKLFALDQGGTIYEVDPVGNSVTEANTGFGGGNNCRSMTFGPDGALYVQCHNGGGTSVKIDKGTPGAGGTYTWTTLVTSEGYPASGTNFDHAFNGLAVSPDGMYLYFGSGSRTDHGEEHGGMREVPMSSAVFRIPTATPTGNIMNTDQSAGTILFADGVRNTFDLAFNDLGDLFGAENGPDMDLADEINFIEMGKHYGFPFRIGDVDNPVMDQNYAWSNTCLPPSLQAVTLGTYEYDAGFPAAPQGATFTDPVLNHGPDSDKFRVCPDGAPMDASDATTTLAGITGHKSPLGLNFDAAGELCGDYNKAGFFLTYGAVEDRFMDAGRDLNLARFTKVGAAYEMAVTQLVAGFEFAPIDAALVGNKIYVVEFGGGSITEITLPVAQ